MGHPAKLPEAGDYNVGNGAGFEQSRPATKNNLHSVRFEGNLERKEVHETMISPIDSNSYNTVVMELRGAHVEVWIFDLTFRRLALLVRKYDGSDIVYVAGVGSRYIRGPFSWKDAKLLFAEHGSDKLGSNGSPLSRIFDDSVGFELLCESIVLFRGSKDDIVNSFDEMGAMLQQSEK